MLRAVFAGMRNVFGTLAPQLRHANFHFCATSSHEMPPPWFREFFACSKLLAYAIRNTLFLKLSSLALSPCFPSPPEPVRNGPGENVTFLTGRLGAILRHLGGQFLCDVNPFLQRFRRGNPLTSLRVSCCCLLAEFHFCCAKSSHSHHLARQIRE